VSRRGEELAADVVAAVLAHTGIAKSAGTVPLLHAVATPLAEAVVARDKALRQAGKAAKKRTKEMRAIGRTLKAIQHGSGPVQHGLVNFRPQEWTTRLTPQREPLPMNGHSSPRMESHDGTHEQTG
jgi:hypothetical protein